MRSRFTALRRARHRGGAARCADCPAVVGTGAAGQRAGHRQARDRRDRRRRAAPRTGRTTSTTCCAARSSSPTGATLNIQAGTRVIGEVRQRRHADRAARRPVERHRHARAADRLHERSAGRHRAPAGTGAASSSTAARRSTSRAAKASGEADTGVYGGDDPNDNSGTLRYVRVEFAGVEFSPDNELNGIAFQGVGRGGSYRVHPGPHEPRRRVSSGSAGPPTSSTPSPPTPPTTASTGRSAGAAGRSSSRSTSAADDADNGIEADNNEFNNNLLPRSNPQIYNITICGDPSPALGGESVRAANLRRGTAFTIRNFLVDRLQDHRLPDGDDQHRDDGADRQRHVAARVGRLLEPRRDGHHGAAGQSDPREHRSVTSTAAGSRTCAPTSSPASRPPASITRTPTSSRPRSPRWPAGSWRRSSRPTTASSSRDLHRRGPAGARR